MIDPDLKISMPGRPTKYTSRTPGKARAFLKRCIDEGRTPFIEELAIELGVADKTLKNWAYPKDGSENEFTVIFELIKTVQKLDIKKKALLGKYEAPISKMILSAEHDVVERFKKEVTGEDGGAIKFESSLSPEQRKEYADQITKLVENINSK